MQKALKKFLQSACLLPQRYVLALMGFAGLANAYQLRVCLNIAITEMSTSNQTVYEEHKDLPGSGFFLWEESVQQLILGSFYWGYVLSHLPGGYLADKFGGKYTLGIGILLTSIFTLIIPAVAEYGYGWILFARFAAGLGEGTTFPGLNDLLARWIPSQERGFLGSVVFAGSQIGTIIGTLSAGFLLDSFKGYWEYVFYLSGGMGIAWFISWVFMCFKDPQHHPYITAEEKEFLNESIGERRLDLPPTPWRRMITSAPVLALICAQIGHDWGFYTMVTNLPKYMKEVLGFDAAKIGVWTSVAFFVMWICSLSTGWLADVMIKKKLLSITNVRKLFTTIAHIGPSVTLVAASYAEKNEGPVIALFVMTLMFMGTFYPGMKVNALDLSPNYAGSLMAVVNGIGGLTGIITPYLIGEIATENTVDQWRLVFWITFVVNIITLIAFLICGSGEVQPWNEPDKIIEEKSADKKTSSF